jgi:hypothetical protein
VALETGTAEVQEPLAVVVPGGLIISRLCRWRPFLAEGENHAAQASRGVLRKPARYVTVICFAVAALRPIGRAWLQAAQSPAVINAALRRHGAVQR